MFEKSNRYLVVDGMVSGTGIRIQYENNYIEPEILKISNNLVEKLNSWHEKYKREFYKGYADASEIHQLDKEGAEIAKRISAEIENCKVSYFSDANLKMKH